MVASEDGDSIWVAHLQAYEEGDSLNGVVATVNVVTHEQVVVLWQLATNFEQLDQIKELAVDVSANGHRSSDTYHITLI